MRKRLLIFGILTCTLVLTGLAADANAEVYVSPEKTALIQSRCTENQATLNTLHQNDAFLRTDRGNVYRTVNDKLMLPFNQRMVANQLNAGQLITVTADFKVAYATFFDSYIEYDNALAALLKIDCKNEPVTYYTALVTVREKRNILSEANNSIVQLINDYHSTFKEFKTKFNQENP